MPGADHEYRRPHGYVFEVPAAGEASAEPLRAMGRFIHEAVAVDPDTGIVYETEDRFAGSGFYRFIPAEAGNLAAGGRLQMLAIDGMPRADLRTGRTRDVWLPVTWVPVDDPDPEGIQEHSIFVQGAAGGGATFARLEGVWHGGGRIYVVSTSGGEAEAGQVWEYDPAGERLRLVFQSPGRDVLDMPDNLCVSPRGAHRAVRGRRDRHLRARSHDRRQDLRPGEERRRARRPAQRLPPATTATGSSPAPPTARTAAGSSSTSRPPASPSP